MDSAKHPVNLEASKNTGMHLGSSAGGAPPIPPPAELSATYPPTNSPEARNPCISSTNIIDLALIDPALLDLPVATTQVSTSTMADSNLPSTPTNTSNERALRKTQLEQCEQNYDSPTHLTSNSSPHNRSRIQPPENKFTASMANNPSSAPTAHNPTEPSTAAAEVGNWVRPNLHPFCCNSLQVRFPVCEQFLYDHPVVAAVIYDLFTNPKSPVINGSHQPPRHENHLATVVWLISVERIIPVDPEHDPEGARETLLEMPTFYITGYQADVWLAQEWVRLHQQWEMDRIMLNKEFRLVNANGFKSLRLGCPTHRQEWAISIWTENHIAQFENDIAITRDYNPPIQPHNPPQIPSQARTRTHSDAFTDEVGSEDHPPASFIAPRSAAHRFLDNQGDPFGSENNINPATSMSQLAARSFSGPQAQPTSQGSPLGSIHDINTATTLSGVLRAVNAAALPPEPAANRGSVRRNPNIDLSPTLSYSLRAAIRASGRAQTISFVSLPTVSATQLSQQASTQDVPVGGAVSAHCHKHWAESHVTFQQTTSGNSAPVENHAPDGTVAPAPHSDPISAPDPVEDPFSAGDHTPIRRAGPSEPSAPLEYPSPSGGESSDDVFEEEDEDYEESSEDEEDD